MHRSGDETAEYVGRVREYWPPRISSLHVPKNSVFFCRIPFIMAIGKILSIADLENAASERLPISTRGKRYSTDGPHVSN